MEKNIYLFILDLLSTLITSLLVPKQILQQLFFNFLEILSFFRLWNAFLEAAPPLLKIHIEETTQQSEGQQEQKLDLIPGPQSQNNLRQLKSTL